jgi:CRP-like cAMP-binding protein
MFNVKSVILNTSLFTMLDERQLERVAAVSSLSRVRADANVVSQGDPASGVYWIVQGQVKIAVNTNNGNEKIIEILGQQTCFGLGEMLLNRPHIAFVKAIADSTVLHTQRDTVLQVAAENFLFAREIMTCVGRQFYGLVRDIDSYSKTARQRLAGYLLRQSRRETSDDIRLIANKGLIASRLSLTRETLSRLFHDFSDSGLIAIAGRSITILDRERMASELRGEGAGWPGMHAAPAP